MAKATSKAAMMRVQELQVCNEDAQVSEKKSSDEDRVAQGQDDSRLPACTFGCPPFSDDCMHAVSGYYLSSSYTKLQMREVFVEMMKS